MNLLTEFPTRLLTLSDGRPGLRGALHVDTTDPNPAIENQNSKIENPNPAVLDFVSSDETLDRYDEIIVASGWRLENYLRNPVFQNSHQYGDILFTLGKALLTEIRQVAGRQVLFQRVEFAIEANPMARIAYGLYKSKFLRAVSVGFIPLRWQNADDGAVAGRSADILSAVSQSSALPGVNPRPVLGLDGALGTGCTPPQLSSPVVRGLQNCRRKYLEQELLEVSAVAIPANPNALSLALKSGAVEKSDLRETLDLLRSLTAESQPEASVPCPTGPTGPTRPTRPPGPPHPYAPALTLARRLREILKRS
jgi:hypothetical protein